MRRVSLPNIGALVADFLLDKVFNSKAGDAIEHSIVNGFSNPGKSNASANGVRFLRDVVETGVHKIEHEIINAADEAATTPHGVPAGWYH